MYILLFFIILALAYISSFKDSFTPENIEKVTPVLAVVAVFILAVSLLGALL